MIIPGRRMFISVAICCVCWPAPIRRSTSDSRRVSTNGAAGREARSASPGRRRPRPWQSHASPSRAGRRFCSCPATRRFPVPSPAPAETKDRAERSGVAGCPRWTRPGSGTGSWTSELSGGAQEADAPGAPPPLKRRQCLHTQETPRAVQVERHPGRRARRQAATLRSSCAMACHGRVLVHRLEQASSRCLHGNIGSLNGCYIVPY